MTIGFIGLGNIGGPMCRTLIAHASAPVIVFDLDPDAVASCVATGAQAAESVADLAVRCDVILSSLPMPRSVEAVALGPGGILESASPGSTYIDLSTNAPSVARRVAEALSARGIAMLDAPVSGGAVGAAAGTIAIMAGGSVASFEQHKALLQSFSATVVHVGESGAGCIVKLINNMLSICYGGCAAEALMLGRASGVDLVKMDEIVRASSGNSMAYRSTAQRGMAGDFAPAFALDLAHKDLRLALELADELGAPVPSATATMNLMRMARGMGLGAQDYTAMIKVYEAAAGITLSGSAASL